MNIIKNIFRSLSAAMLLLLLCACAATPVYPPQWATSQATPHQVAQSPEQFADAHVIWGGRIVSVDNKADHTEVEILAYPLDDSQQPEINDVGNGRFIALLPGYVERMNYPHGDLVTLQGQIRGVRSSRVGEAPYVFPLLDVRDAHVWSKTGLRNRSRVHFSVGVGVGIR